MELKRQGNEERGRNSERQVEKRRKRASPL